MTYLPERLAVLAAAALFLATIAGSQPGIAAAAVVSTGPTCPSTAAAGAFINTAQPTISGTPAVGSTLTVSNGSWSYQGNPVTPGQFTYQWFNDDGAQVGGNSTTNTYVVTANDVGHIIYAHVIAYYACGIGGAADSNNVQVPDTGDEMGDPEPDTSAPISPDSDGTPATPQPVSPSGPLPAGSYSTELWTSDETGPDDGTNVVSSTASGTSALTGVVMDANSDALVPGATVRMASSTASTTTTSDASGAYAFANMPAGTYTVTISAPGYGSYTLLNSAFAGDQYYELTTTLDTSAQTFDEAAQGASAQTSASPYPFTLVYSPTRTPPSVRVGIYPLNSDCSRAGSSYSVVNLPWVYYLLRVADAEVIGNHYNQVGQKAFFSLAQNFGWYHKLSGGVWDVDNSTVTQCYRNPPRYKIPGTWKSWINDVLDERVTDSTSRLVQTQYNAGTSPPKCPDPSYPQHGQYASQNTINILSENGNANAGCAKRTDWRDIVRYWYPNSPVVQLVYRPPIPVASATFPGDGHIHFHFTARQYSANTAWYFAVRVKTSSGWSPIGKKIGWAWRTRGSGDCIISGHSVGTCLDYFPPDTACHRYEVVAHNPRGDSLPAQFTKKGIGYNRSGTCNLT